MYYSKLQLNCDSVAEESTVQLLTELHWHKPIDSAMSFPKFLRSHMFPNYVSISTRPLVSINNA